MQETDRNFEKRKKVIYQFMQDELYVPMKLKEIAAVLRISREEKEELRAVLNELETEGKISLSKRGKYSISKEKHLTGCFRANLKGFGFVTVEDEASDIYIGAEYTGTPGRKGDKDSEEGHHKGGGPLSAGCRKEIRICDPG